MGALSRTSSRTCPAGPSVHIGRPPSSTSVLGSTSPGAPRSTSTTSPGPSTESGRTPMMSSRASSRLSSTRVAATTRLCSRAASICSSPTRPQTCAAEQRPVHLVLTKRERPHDDDELGRRVPDVLPVRLVGIDGGTDGRLGATASQERQRERGRNARPRLKPRPPIHRGLRSRTRAAIASTVSPTVMSELSTSIASGAWRSGATARVVSCSSRLRTSARVSS